MDFKPSVFIGYALEASKTAALIKAGLDEIADCKEWIHDFDLGKSNYENLVTHIAYYDYAIMIAQGEDLIISRKKSARGTRDNVLFEFGLFAGGLGRSKVFFIMEQGTRIPTDLYGISLSFIPNKSSPDFKSTVAHSISRIKAHIINKEKTFDIGFLPSTALAYGYFSNFVQRTTERLLIDKQQHKVFTLQSGVDFSINTIEFTILLPHDLSDNMFNKVKAKRLRDNWQKMKLASEDIRDYDFSIDTSKAVHGDFHLVDIPFTLNALYKAIEIYSAKEYIGKTGKESILEYREIRNFKRTLEYLISTHAITTGIVNIEIVSI
ncbi:STING domain-containing protein [Mucilaginibacter sp. OK283]|uniref:STING domain-containing protein n=1 Tax=Mucilaginibacter sp. OK283 TaxID=1881049 RepID=UPI0008BC30BE|nr:STING domain-containing protein [Mucilaginibacter sp. OK283]SEO51109.1 Predicted nucleotide-binding protein containing TIR-like domain-containing protein [Mucilaginibacter sp. OK283]